MPYPGFKSRDDGAGVGRQVSVAAGIPAPAGLIRRVLAAQDRERKRLLDEMSKVRGLVPLLMKPRDGERWTAAERTLLRDDLRALAHLSPYLLLLALPGSALLLPLLAWWLDRRRQIRNGEPPTRS